MYNATEQFAELNKANVAQVTKFAALAIENTEKLVKLNLSLAKAAIAQSVEGAEAAATVKDVQELLALRSKYNEANMQNALGYSRNVYEIAQQAQSQYKVMAEEAWAGYTKNVAAWMEKATQGTPGGSDVAVNILKSTIAASTAAFDQFQKATNQVVNLADANVRAAAANASKVAPKGRKAA